MQRYLLEPLLISMCLAGFRVVDSESIFLVGSVSVTDSQIQNASKIDNLSSIIHWQKFFFIHLKLLTFIHNTLGKNLTLWWIILGRILIRVLSVSRFVSGSSEGSGTGFRFGFFLRIGSDPFTVVLETRNQSREISSGSAAFLSGPYQGGWI